MWLSSSIVWIIYLKSKDAGMSCQEQSKREMKLKLNVNLTPFVF